MAEAFLQLVIENLSSLIQGEIGMIMGVDDEMKKLSSTLTTIQAVLEDAEMKQIESKPIQNWLRKLNDLTYEIDDILDECATEASQLKHKNIFTRYSLGEFLHRRNVGKRMKEVAEELDAVAAEREKFHLREMAVQRPREVAAWRETSSVLNESDHVFGRDEDKEEIVDILLNRVVENRPSKKRKVEENQGISVLPIIGVGGLGKTTLAQLIFNDQRVVRHFEKRIWVCVSDNFDLKTLIKAVIESASGNECGLSNLDPLQRRLWELLNQKKYLLVLDDVWNDGQEKWSKLKDALACGSSGSTIIVTTRLKKVADIMGTLPAHYLKGLSEEHCWMLLRERAFGQDKNEYPNLEAIGRQIVKKCAGVPLAAKALGGILRFKRTEKDWIYVKKSELWNLPQEETSILPALKLSYHHLPLELRQCFAYCAVFPKDSEIDKDELIFCWMAHGYISAKGILEVQEVGNEICNELLLRSLLQEVPGRENPTFDMYDPVTRTPTFNMHDLIHDLAQSIMENKIPGTQAERNVPHGSNGKVRQVNMREKYVAFPKSYYHEMDMHSILTEYSRLRILDASSRWMQKVRITDLPSAVGNLKHLRCVNLSSAEVCSLPKSLCSLWNLEILNLTDCDNLVALPKNMRRLKNLRHLILEGCTGLKEMPPKIGELTCLRTLSLFTVGRKRGKDLEELQFLNLGGKLEIRHLERVQNPMDARKANLSEKKDLRYLKLVWLERNDASKSKGEDVEEKVLEALEPHPNLETLIIIGFNGRCFPIETLENLINLKKLHISGEDCVVSVPEEGMRGLKSLTHLWIRGSKTGACLREGWFRHLSTTLEELWIVDCGELVELGEGMKYLHNLKSLTLSKLPKMVRLPEAIQHLSSSLQSLYLWGLPELASLPDWMGNLTSLQLLHIYHCEKIASLPESMRGMVNLKSLAIWRCPELQKRCEKEKGDDWHKIAHIPLLNIRDEFCWMHRHFWALGGRVGSTTM